MRSTKLGKTFTFLCVGIPFLLTGASKSQITTTLPEKQVIGGLNALIEDYPFMGALVYSTNTEQSGQFCGCTAIDPYWVLTAAHCLDRELSITDFKIVFNTANLDHAGIEFEPRAIYFHPDYASIFNYNHDLALVQLSSALPNDITPIELISNADFEEPGLTAKVLGWGGTQADPLDPANTSQLQEADLPLVSQEFAIESGYYEGFVNEWTIAAGDFDPFRSIYYGDSGGPLLIQNPETGNWEQIGVASLGSACNIANNPVGLFSRILPHEEWITKTIRSGFYHWIHKYYPSGLFQDDGDPYSALVEWGFGLDPSKPDELILLNELELSNDQNQRSVFVPLTLQNPFPLLNITRLSSLNLNNWVEENLDWMNLEWDSWGDSREYTYRAPVLKKDDQQFYRLSMSNPSGDFIGPFILRPDGISRGYLKGAIGSPTGSLQGPSRFGYLLELPDRNRRLMLKINSEQYQQFQVTLYEVETLKKIFELTHVGTTPFNQSFKPNPDTNYLLILEQLPNSGRFPFEITLDYQNGSPLSPVETLLKGSLDTTDDPYKREGFYSDSYLFDLNDQPWWKVTVSSDTLDPIIVVKDSTTNRRLFEVDEEPPGESEEFVVVARDALVAEIIAGSWRFGETGNYEIQVSRFDDVFEVSPNDEILGLLSGSDFSDRFEGVRIYFDFLDIENVSSLTGATFTVYGLVDFIPGFGIVDMTTGTVIHQAISFCKGAQYFFKPQTGHEYQLYIFSSEDDLSENYKVLLEPGDTRFSPEEQSGLNKPVNSLNLSKLPYLNDEQIIHAATKSSFLGDTLE